MNETKRRPRQLSRLFADSRSPQSTLFRRAGSLLRWQRLLEREMSPEFTGQWRLARLDEQALVLYANSPAWATRLRYVGALIRQTVAANGGPASHKIVVRVAAPEPLERHPPRRELSVEAAAALDAAARSTTEPRLAAALRRLSRRAGSGDKGSE